MKIAHTDVVVASRSQLSTSVGSETVILHTDKGEYFGLNEVGASIWRLVQQPRSVEEIKSELVSEYDVTPEQCEEDLMQILAQLVEAGLIEIRDGSTNT